MGQVCSDSEGPGFAQLVFPSVKRRRAALTTSCYGPHHSCSRFSQRISSLTFFSLWSYLLVNKVFHKEFEVGLC